MKYTTFKQALLVLIGYLLLTGNVIAEDRMITFEMGESGQTVSFPMTEEEKAFSDYVAAYAKSKKETNQSKQKLWIKRVELPESGQYIEFEMTDKEIGEVLRREVEKPNNEKKVEHNRGGGEVIEMVDGYSIVFFNDGSTKWDHSPIN